MDRAAQLFQRRSEVGVPVRILPQRPDSENQFVHARHRATLEFGQQVTAGRRWWLALGTQRHIVVDDPALVLQPDSDRVVATFDRARGNLEDHRGRLADGGGLEADARVTGRGRLRWQRGLVHRDDDARTFGGRPAGQANRQEQRLVLNLAAREANRKRMHAAAGPLVAWRRVDVGPLARAALADGVHDGIGELPEVGRLAFPWTGEAELSSPLVGRANAEEQSGRILRGRRRLPGAGECTLGRECTARADQRENRQ
jgi:hypothetical protein